MGFDEGERLDERLRKLGFEWDKEYKEGGTSERGVLRSGTEVKFFREQESLIPRIELIISQDAERGIKFALYSVPWDPVYSSSTHGIVSEKEAILMIGEYINRFYGNLPGNPR